MDYFIDGQIKHDQQEQPNRIETKMPLSRQAILDETSTPCFDLQDLIPAGHITVDPQGMILEADIIAANLIGMNCDTLVNMPISKIIFYEDLDIFYHHLWKLYETGCFHCFELRMIKSDGTNFNIFMQAAAAPNTVGANVVYIAFFETNTQKEALRVLRASEEKNRMIAENNSDIIWIYNLNQKRYTFFSSSIQQFLGYTVEEALTLSMEGFMTPKSYLILSEQFSKTVGLFVIDPETPNRYVNEIQQTGKNGKNIWVEVITKYQYNSLREIEVFGLTRKIVEQKEAENKLMKERELVRNMLLFLPMGIILTDESGKVTFMNIMAERLSGYRKNEVDGKEYDKVFKPINLLTREKQPNPVSYVLETGNSFTSTQNSGLIRKDGSEINFTYTASPIPTDDAKIKGVIVTGRDTTKENEHETEIEGFLNSNSELRCVVDTEGNFQRVNTQFEEILGYHASEIEGENLHSFVHEGDIQATQDAFSNAKYRYVITLINRFRCKNGSYKYIEWYTVPDSGRAVYYSGKDVTDRQNREELLKDQEIFFNTCPDMMIVFQSDGFCIKVNHACEIVLGYTKEEIVGRNFSQIVNSNTITRDEIVAKQRAQPNQIINFIDLFGLKDGSYRNIEWSVYSVNEYICAIARDVTARIEYEKQIEFSSYHDTLTGLFNRRFWDEEIKRMDTARNLPISFIMGDINRLKLVNDVFGHEKGDELITKIAESIKASCRPEDLVARWGGDEFMIFLPKTSASEAGGIVERILTNCADKQVNAIPVSIAFGIHTKIAASEMLSDVMRKAEDSMYTVKEKEYQRNGTEIIDTIAHFNFKNNPYEEQHAKRVSILCTKIAQALGLPEEEVEKLSMEGLLHDIGKAGVNKEILQKPSSLTQDEKKAVSLHSEIGYKIVGLSQDMIDIGNAIRAHHERMDGKGYPKGIPSNDIPVAARIISIADSYDTMTCQTLYRKTITKEEAIIEIRRNEGTQFDAEIAEAFIEKVLRS